MKRLLFITHIPYWLRDTGDRARLFTLVRFFKPHAFVTVAFMGSITKNDRLLIAQCGDSSNVIFLGDGQIPSLNQYGQLLNVFLLKNGFDVCIIEHVALSFLLPYIPKGAKLMLDAHDLVCERLKSFAKFGCKADFFTDSVSEDQEIEYFKMYDSVILIQKNEYEKVCGIIGKERALLAPHPAILNQRKIYKEVKTIGYVASNYAPNVYAINWFINNVWPKLSSRKIILKIIGAVGSMITAGSASRIFISGVLQKAELFYDDIDIVINPVFFGAGLKIKNIEALANGLPLVTTTHGSEGIEEGANSAFLVSDTAELFHSHIVNLISDFNLRKTLAENAYCFAKERFSYDSCFGSLLHEVNK